ANMETALPEYVPDDPLARALFGERLTMRDVLDALARAADDGRVAGLIARVGAAPLGMAQVQELRDAVRRFREKKKFALAFAETLGEFGPGGNAYYLATAFDEIWLQPSGDVGLTGVLAEAFFLRGTLDKLGITPRLDHRYEYKNAMNIFTERKFTPAHKEATERVVKSFASQMVRGIAEGRGMSEHQVRALIDRGPLLGPEALEAKLVDGLAYREQVYDKVKERAGRGAKVLSLAEYLQRAGRPHTKGKTIALIYGVGGVQRGKSGFDPVFGEIVMGSDTVAAAFRAAARDKDVKAILFRIDSPGGSYVASDTIWQETVRARKAGKPVIVSMGDVAGSGGYFVAMAADKIVAQPGTITGSIGVLGGKMLTTGFWNKLGITWDEVHEGANATFWSGTSDYTPAQWARFQAWLDRIYDDFTNKVAEGRRLPKQRVLEIAKGRIWTGEDAKALGLVDELGGFETALRLAKQAAGIPEKEEVRLKLFPPKKSLLEVIVERIQGAEPDEQQESSVAALRRALEIVQPVARRMRALDPARAPLWMPWP
ncbi:MAG: signal peptide peptidase SppA, partial [Bryobacteraceae bacterium]